MALAANLQSSRSMMPREIVLLVLSFLLHYGISAWYLFYQGWTWPMEHSLMEEISVKSEGDELSATYFFIFFFVLVPFVSSSYNAYKKYIDDRDAHIKVQESGVFILLATIALLHAIGIIVCTGLMLESNTAWGLCFFTIFLSYTFIAFSIYRNRDYTWPNALKIINGILYGGIFILVVCYAAVD
jgi:hypothetical protein